MSGAGSTDDRSVSCALLRDAARGVLPAWAEASEERREHIGRVAELMAGWAAVLDLPPAERDRWRAAAWLHDALRDADPERLRAELPEPFRDLPDLLLHGPAAAERLRGHADLEVRDAVRYHTLGHPSFGLLGKSLYLADFLEPGRSFAPEWRAELRTRMPENLDAVLIEVLAARIAHQLDERRPVRPETMAFWNSLVRETP